MNIQAPELSGKPGTRPRQGDIDFLFLDLNACSRCVGTDMHLETAAKALEPASRLAGVRLNIHAGE